MNKKKGFNLFTFILVFGLVMIMLNSLTSLINKPNTLSIQQLVDAIDQYEVANITITPNNGVYVIKGLSVSSKEGKEINKQLLAKQNGKMEQNKYNQVFLMLQQANIAGKTPEQEKQYITSLQKDVTKNNVLLNPGALLKNENNVKGTSFETVIVNQEYQIKMITDALNKSQIVYNVIPYKPPFDWMGFILQVGSFAILGFFIFSMMKGKAPGVENKEFSPKVPNVRFKDVIGYEEEKQELSELVDFLKNPSKYHKMGAKLPRGVLLEGPPGTGKTLMAKAVAGESNVPFFAASGSDFEEMYVGLGASRIRKLFKEAKKNAPAIIFIDEIDAIGKRSNSSNMNPAQNQTINSLLVEMDGFDANENVIIMGATNRKNNLDEALLRPGRFDRQILVDLPPVATRKAILQYHLQNKTVANNVDYDSLARSTTGMSGAQLSAVANEAALLAVRDRKNDITQLMLQEAIDRVLMGPAKITNKYSAKDKRVVSYHESGHCIVGLELEGAMEVQKITIIPRRDAGGYVSYIPSEEEERFITKSQLLDRLTSLLAGRCSEEIFIGDITIGAFNDFEQATNIARAMITKYGMSSLGVYQYEANGSEDLYAQKQYSDSTADKIDAEINNILNHAYKRAKDILIKRSDDIHLLAKTIREYEVLDKEQIDYLLKHRCLPEDLNSIYHNQNSDSSQEDNIPKPPQSSESNNSSEQTPSNNDDLQPAHKWPRNDTSSEDFM